MTTIDHWAVYRKNDGQTGTVGWTNESQARNDVKMKNDDRDAGYCRNYDEADYVQSDERPDPAEVLDDE